MENILQELRKPFSPSVITWKPGAVSREGTSALGMAYADPRAYMDRLDEVCGMEWAVSYTPWGDRVICHVTINGITRSSTGEPDSQSEKSEIAGTATEAQAFKRACAMFGLGRYLYNLPAVWADYNKEQRRFTDKGLAKLEGIIATHYKQAMNGQPTAGAASEQAGSPLGQEEQQQEKRGAAADDAGASLRKQFDNLGEQLYGEQWEQVRRHNVERITKGEASDAGQLNVDQLGRLIGGLKSLQRSRARQRKAA